MDEMNGLKSKENFRNSPIYLLFLIFWLFLLIFTILFFLHFIQVDVHWSLNLVLQIARNWEAFVITGHVIAETTRMKR